MTSQQWVRGKVTSSPATQRKPGRDAAQSTTEDIKEETENTKESWFGEQVIFGFYANKFQDTTRLLSRIFQEDISSIKTWEITHNLYLWDKKFNFSKHNLVEESEILQRKFPFKQVFCISNYDFLMSELFLTNRSYLDSKVGIFLLQIDNFSRFFANFWRIRTLYSSGILDLFVLLLPFLYRR